MFIPDDVFSHILAYCDDRIEKKRAILYQKTMKSILDVIIRVNTKRRFYGEEPISSFSPTMYRFYSHPIRCSLTYPN